MSVSLESRGLCIAFHIRRDQNGHQEDRQNQIHVRFVRNRTLCATGETHCPEKRRESHWHQADGG